MALICLEYAQVSILEISIKMQMTDLGTCGFYTNIFLRRTVLVKEEFPITQQEDTDSKIILEVLDLTRACVESNLPSLKMDQVCSAF